MEKKMSKAIAYYRVSRPSQKHSLSVQKELVRDYCNKNKIELIFEFEEITSGEKKKQLELEKALKLLEVNNCPIICTTIDRLTRDYLFGKHICENYDTIFVFSPTMPLETKLELLHFGEKEKQLISQRTKLVLSSLKKRGVKLGNPNANITDEMRTNSIASRRNDARLNENNSKAYKLVCLLLSRGKNFSEIARELNDNGYLTSRNKHWQTIQVQRLIKLYDVR